jgi:hypothetical protein
LDHGDRPCHHSHCRVGGRCPSPSHCLDHGRERSHLAHLVSHGKTLHHNHGFGRRSYGDCPDARRPGVSLGRCHRPTFLRVVRCWISDHALVGHSDRCSRRGDRGNAMANLRSVDDIKFDIFQNKHIF